MQGEGQGVVTKKKAGQRAEAGEKRELEAR